MRLFSSIFNSPAIIVDEETCLPIITCVEFGSLTKSTFYISSTQDTIKTRKNYVYSKAPTVIGEKEMHEINNGELAQFPTVPSYFLIDGVSTYSNKNINVESLNCGNIQNIKIYNLNGRVVYSETIKTDHLNIDLSSLSIESNSIYLLHVQFESGESQIERILFSN